MIKQVEVEGLSDLQKQLDTLKDEEIFILFTGSKDSSGKSWCPDCNDAQPVITKVLQKAPDTSVFITCIVGDRPIWKNPENEFRKHEDYKLTGIPTLLKWKTSKRLGPDDCKKEDLVEMVFED